MASHLTIITGASATGTIGKAFAGQSAAAQDATSQPAGLLGLFAALLGNAGLDTDAAVPAPAPGANSTQTTPGFDLAELFRLGLDASSGDATQQDQADPEALAAAIDLPGQATALTDPKPMVNFVEALGALKASLDRGEPLDPALLEQVETALNGLAEALGLDLEALAVPEDFAALLDTTGADDTGLAGALTQLLAPLAQSLAVAQPGTDAASAAETPLLDNQLKALGDKLGALLAALTEGDVAAEKLAALGMAPGQPLDAEIEAALARFAAGLAQQTAAVPEEPVLATPALKLSEPVLSGKSAGAPDTLDASSATRTAPEQSGASGGERDTDSQAGGGRDRADATPRDMRGNNPPATAPVDASNMPAPSADANAQATNSLRLDAAANPRIIQAGYQTSQQQLNLPQIAFELARQVQDGNTRFQIRLDPPELGRIDVRLDINETGQVNARLVVEKSETLDLMQRDQRGLERALQQAGLDGAKTNLEFSLKQNPFSGQQGQMGDGGGENGSDGGLTANDNGLSGEAEEAPPMVNLYRGALQASGVNIIA